MINCNILPLVHEKQALKKDYFLPYRAEDIYCPMCEQWHEDNTLCKAYSTQSGRIE